MKLSKETMEELRQTVEGAFTKSSDARFVRRLDILTLVFSGNEAQEVAKIYRISRVTISNWISKLRKEGINGLKDKKGKGKKQVLSNVQKQSLKDDLSKSPFDFGYKQARWDGKLLAHHLKSRYSIEFKVRKCQYLFHELGFSPEKTSICT
jgi:transposase